MHENHRPAFDCETYDPYSVGWEILLPKDTCPACGKEKMELVEDFYKLLDDEEIAAILEDHPDWKPDKVICVRCIDYYKLNH